MPVLKVKKNGVWENVSGVLKHTHTASDITDLDINGGNADTVDGMHASDFALASDVASKYEKPSGGIPKTDLTADVQTSLGKADTAIQSLNGYATESYVNEKISGTGTFTEAERSKLAGIEEGATRVVVDEVLSDTSTNPVQNKIIASVIAELQDAVGSDSISAQISAAIALLNLSGTYVSISQLGIPGGVATLGSDGKILPSQFHAAASGGLLPQIIVNVPINCTITCTQGSYEFMEESTGKTTFSVPNYGTWNIVATSGKRVAQSSVTIDTVKQHSIILEFFAATLTVTAESGATVTVNGNGETLSKTVPSGSTKVTFDIYSAGSYTVSAVSTDGSSANPVTVNITASNQTYSCECKFYSTTLSNNTWAQIAKASESGKASSLWKVGDEKNITVGSETLTLVIIGFDHDDKSDGTGKAGITFALKNLMAETSNLSVNNSGFKNSDMYAWLSGTIFTKLPSDLRSVIKTVNKLTKPGYNVKTEDVTLFLFSGVEVLGSAAIDCSPSEGSQYSYFTTSSKRIKYLSNGTGAVSGWKLRSWIEVDMGDGSTMEYPAVISTTGVESSSGGSGVCFGFCV